MSGGETGRGDFAPIPYEYLHDGYIRRQTHEFGVTGFKIYREFLDKMDFQPGHIAIDIGAGMGQDALAIASNYYTRMVYMLEPSGDGFADRYYQRGLEIEQQKLAHVALLPAITESHLRGGVIVPDFSSLEENMAYLQPLDGRAESIPLADNSVDRATIVHSAYEFTDLDAALAEIARVLRPGGLGGLITNGPGDKQVFKEKLGAMKDILEAGAPEGTIYEAPSTVSSRLDYFAAREALKRHFKKVVLFNYHDRMKIDNDKKRDHYEYSFDTYRRAFRPRIINNRRWTTAREKAFEAESRHQPFYDTIDTGWVLFSDPL